VNKEEGRRKIDSIESIGVIASLIFNFLCFRSYGDILRNAHSATSIVGNIKSGNNNKKIFFCS
jgi:hypothetical protein